MCPRAGCEDGWVGWRLWPVCWHLRQWDTYVTTSAFGGCRWRFAHPGFFMRPDQVACMLSQHIQSAKNGSGDESTPLSPRNSCGQRGGCADPRVQRFYLVFQLPGPLPGPFTVPAWGACRAPAICMLSSTDLLFFPHTILSVVVAEPAAA